MTVINCKKCSRWMSVPTDRIGLIEARGAMVFACSGCSTEYEVMVTVEERVDSTLPGWWDSPPEPWPEEWPSYAHLEARMHTLGYVDGAWYKKWYSEDVKTLLDDIANLRNKVVNLKRKLDKGPCGACRKVPVPTPPAK